MRKLQNITLKKVWDGIELPIVFLIITFLFISCLVIAANQYEKEKGEYPKAVEIGMSDAIKVNIVVIGSHEYIVTTYTTKTGAGISTIHNQSCKFCKSKNK